MSYPNTIKQFVTKIDKNASGYYVGPEYFNVPSVSPYQIYLDHVPRDSATTAIGASGGGAWLEVFVAPVANQYLVDYDYGEITFAAANAGAAVQATYYNLGDDIMAEHVNSLQDEIVIVETALAVGVNGGYPTLKARLDAADASGIDGQRIIDNTVRAGALMDDIKGANWVVAGRPTLTSIIAHEIASSAHMAQAIDINQPLGVTATTVQDHIEATGLGTRSDRNPHGMSMFDINGGILDGSLGAETITAHLFAASGNVTPIDALAYGASGMYDVGSARHPFASGNFDVVRAQDFYAGSYSGVDGSFTAGANTIIVRKGLIVSIL